MVIISSSFFFLALIIIIVVYTAPGTMYDIVARIADDGENRFEIKCGGDLGWLGWDGRDGQQSWLRLAILMWQSSVPGTY